MIKVNAKEAKAICERLGLSYEDGQVTYWAYDIEADEIYDFDTRSERDRFISVEDDRLPTGYAEIEYADMDSCEAHMGMKFDDMNFMRYMER